MNLFKRLLAVTPLVLLLFFAQSSVTSCQKETDFIRDTIFQKDTLIIKDTVRITDTVCCSNLMDSLVGYYNFNGGNLNDSSGKNNHIVFSNAINAPDRFGKANNAYKFDGSSSFMRVSNHQSLNPNRISLMAVVKFDGFYHGLCHANQILKKGFQDQNDGIYGLRAGVTGIACHDVVDTTKEQFQGYYGNTQSSSAWTFDKLDYIQTGKWITVVFTYDGAVAKLYVDGKLKQALNQTVPFTPNSFDLFIGRAENPQNPYWFNGVIDEIRIYEKALCEADVQILSRLKK